MSMISNICIGGIVIILLSCIRRNADLFSPFRVFGLVWFTAIGVTDMKFSRLQSEWSLFVWMVLLLGIGSFILGNFIVYVITAAKKKFTVREIRTIVQRAGVDERRMFFAIMALSVLYCTSLTIEAILTGGLPINSPFPDRARIEFGMFGLHLFVASIPTILVLIVEYFFLVKGSGAKKLILGVVFLIVAGSYMTLLVRLNYAVFLIMAAAAAYYTSDYFRMRNVVMTLAIIIILFSYVQQAREARYAENFIYVISDMKFSKDYAAFAGVYMYIVMNLENFARLVSHLDYYTYGYYSFDFLFALSGLKHSLAEYYGLVERLYSIGSFNTFPFLLPYFRDFGLLGVFAFPFGLGFGIGSIYYWMVASGRLLAIATYSFCVFFMVISFFTNPLTMLNYVFTLTVFLLSHVFFTTGRQPATAGGV